MVILVGRDSYITVSIANSLGYFFSAFILRTSAIFVVGGGDFSEAMRKNPLKHSTYKPNNAPNLCLSWQDAS